LGRLASKQEIIEKLEILKSKDQAAIIIDLIFGLPGQSMELWEKDIATFLELNIDGVDLYQLIQFPGGMLKKAIERKQMLPAADTTQRSAMFARGVELMNNARCRRLSISHWGRGFRERNLYNLFMKAKSNCLAFGSGAGGNIDGTAYFIEGTIDKYLDQAGKVKPVAHMMKPSKYENMICLIAGELELGCIDLNAVGRQLGRDLKTLFNPLVTQWEQAGLVTNDDGWMTLTLAGEFWQTNLAQGMIDFYIETVSRP
jgi:oxygen-independent coproporphyrinogen-3 oxidase